MGRGVRARAGEAQDTKAATSPILERQGRTEGVFSGWGNKFKDPEVIYCIFEYLLRYIKDWGLGRKKTDKNLSVYGGGGHIKSFCKN